jgi:predicted lipoprotein with Yx(FWY)xxD motif
MTHRPWKQAIRAIAVTAGVALALAVTGVAGTPAGAATSKKVVGTATVPGMGVILVDTQGHALYTHTDPTTGKAVACTGACATIWPPLTVAAGTKVKTPKGVKGLATMKGTHQVTKNGLPLYRFSQDQAMQAKGSGANGFGGTWHVVTVNASPTKSTGTKNAGTGGVSF